VKVVFTHYDHLKIFVEIQSHHQMEEECLKMFGSPNEALVAKGNRPRCNKYNRGRLAKKVSRAPHKGKPKALERRT